MKFISPFSKLTVKALIDCSVRFSRTSALRCKTSRCFCRLKNYYWLAEDCRFKPGDERRRFRLVMASASTSSFYSTQFSKYASVQVYSRHRLERANDKRRSGG